MYKVERWEFKRGKHLLFYVSEEQNPSPDSVNVRYYFSRNTIKNYELELLEEGVYTVLLKFYYVGKFVLIFSEIFSENNERKLIVIVTIK